MKTNVRVSIDEIEAYLKMRGNDVVKEFNSVEHTLADHFRQEVRISLPHPQSESNSPLFKGLRKKVVGGEVKVESTAMESRYRKARGLEQLPSQFGDWDYAPRVNKYGTKYFKPLPLGGGRYRLWADPEHPRLGQGYFTRNFKKLNRELKSGKGTIWKIIASQLAQAFANK